MDIFNRELENEVITLAINDNECKDLFNQLLTTPTAFYYEIHRFVYNEVRTSNTSLKIKLRTKLKNNKRFSPTDVSGFRFDYHNTKGYKEKCYLILELYARRLALEASELITRGLVNGTDIFQLRAEAQIKLESIDNLISTDKIKTIGELIPDIQEEAKTKHESDVKETGLRSGLKEFDYITGGFQDSDLFIMAARPGMGKTAKILSIAINIVKRDIPVAFFSLEMSAVQLVKRSIAQCSEVNAMIINNGAASTNDFDKWNAHAEDLKTAPLYIDDTFSLKLVELSAKVRKLVKDMGVRLIIVDYLQLMSADVKGNREQEISSISRGLKGIAKENNIPVVALSQLSRSVETRGGDKRPMLSDLRESGAIEQDADIVTFIFRPEYYGITEDEEGNSTEGSLECIFAKHRNGALGTAKSRFIADIARVEDIEQFNNDAQPNNWIEPNRDFDTNPF